MSFPPATLLQGGNLWKPLGMLPDKKWAVFIHPGFPLKLYSSGQIIGPKTPNGGEFNKGNGTPYFREIRRLVKYHSTWPDSYNPYRKWSYGTILTTGVYRPILWEFWPRLFVWVEHDDICFKVCFGEVMTLLWNSRWWFQIFVIFTPIWGWFLIFFKGVGSTTDRMNLLLWCFWRFLCVFFPNIKW